MNKNLLIYMYNVRFGEAILIKIPDGGKNRFILVDAGNWQSGQAGLNQPLLDALKDIHKRTKGKIDLYVMTHEHMDHVEGLRSADSRDCKFEIDTVWMTKSSELGYYEKEEFKDAKEKKIKLQAATKAFWSLSDASKLSKDLQALYELNAVKTVDCVDFIREAGKKVYYVYRGYNLNNKHPFTDVGLRILAPEKKTAVYYKSLEQHIPQLSLTADSTLSGSSLKQPMPLPGIDGGDFYNLIKHMDGAFSESVFSIDAAGNNTSIVFELTWKGRRLLFAGDAEEESWEKMYENINLKPVDFFKIGHHGSITARPPLNILDKILPEDRREQAFAAVSTRSKDPFNSIPNEATMKSIKTRTKKLYSTESVADGKPVRIRVSPAN